LQEFEFEQVGGTKTFHVDSRVILATNENLQTAVAEGRFRLDLYYRINVINIELPALRERIGDIPMLARHFLAQIVAETGRKVEAIADDAMQALQRYSWPGNVRELQNAIERGVLLGKGDTIQLGDLPAHIASGAAPLGQLQTSSATAESASQRLKAALAAPERQIILDVLREHRWNRNATADALGINRTTLYKKMKRLGLEEPTR
jgi:two-component system response regulator AtoC